MKFSVFLPTVLFATYSFALFAGSSFIEIIPKELKASDIKLMQEYAREELVGKREGAMVSWSNDETSNSGTVTLVKHFEQDDKKCMKILHRVQLNANADNFSFEAKLCEDAAGKWYNVN